MPVSCARPLHYLILVEFAYPQSLSTIMYANEPFVSKVYGDFVEQFFKENPPIGIMEDMTSNLMWKDQEEFQEVLWYWSSRFRAIETSKVSNPIDPEFESSWNHFYASERVSELYLAGSGY